MIHSHTVLHENYVGDEKAYTLVCFWVFTEPVGLDSNSSVCSGIKKVHIYHKLKAAYYESDCHSPCLFANKEKLPFTCIDEICFFVEKMFPDYHFFGSKKYLKNYFKEFLF